MDNTQTTQELQIKKIIEAFGKDKVNQIMNDPEKEEVIKNFGLKRLVAFACLSDKTLKKMSKAWWRAVDLINWDIVPDAVIAMNSSKDYTSRSDGYYGNWGHQDWQYVDTEEINTPELMEELTAKRTKDGGSRYYSSRNTSYGMKTYDEQAVDEWRIELTKIILLNNADDINLWTQECTWCIKQLACNLSAWFLWNAFNDTEVFEKLLTFVRKGLALSHMKLTNFNCLLQLLRKDNYSTTEIKAAFETDLMFYPEEWSIFMEDRLAHHPDSDRDSAYEFKQLFNTLMSHDPKNCMTCSNLVTNAKKANTAPFRFFIEHINNIFSKKKTFEEFEPKVVETKGYGFIFLNNFTEVSRTAGELRNCMATNYNYTVKNKHPEDVLFGAYRLDENGNKIDKITYSGLEMKLTDDYGTPTGKKDKDGNDIFEPKATDGKTWRLVQQKLYCNQEPSAMDKKLNKRLEHELNKDCWRPLYIPKKDEEEKDYYDEM